MCLQKRSFKLLAFTEMKMKGNGDILWCGVSCICRGIQKKEKIVENVTILLNVWHSVEVDFRYVSSRIYWLNWSWNGLRCVVVVAYETSEEMKKKGKVLVRVSNWVWNSFRFWVMRDLNGRVRDMMRMDTTNVFEVSQMKLCRKER